MIDDPGWWSALRALPTMWLPGRSARLRREVPLIGLRAVFLVVPVVITLILPVLWFVLDDKYAAPSSLHLLIVGIVGIGCVVAVLAFRRMPLKGETGPELARAFQVNMFLKMAYAEFVVVVAFVFCLAMGAPLWVYLIGMAFSFVGLALAAPGVADVRRRREEISGRGLADALGQFSIR